MNTFPYKRIVVIGVAGAGKSTLAQRLSEKLGVRYIELDALYWQAGWQEPDPFVFWEQVEDAIEADSWVAAGNYGNIRFVIWPRAEAVIWLDYPLHIAFWRLLKRTIQRALTREELWNGNRETFWRHLPIWSRKSLFHWQFITYRRWKRETPTLLSLPNHKHLKVFHFKHPREAEEWFDEL
jgi:adenylate kinase family enzyme